MWSTALHGPKLSDRLQQRGVRPLLDLAQALAMSRVQQADGTGALPMGSQSRRKSTGGWSDGDEDIQAAARQAGRRRDNSDS